jgi:hypothetical protein
MGHLRFLIFAAFLGLCSPSFGAIAFDATSNSGGAQSSVGSISWSHTCTGSELVLAVGVILDTPSAAFTVSSVSYNSVSLGLAQAQGTSNASGRRVELWYLAGPSTGSASIAITLSGTIGSTDAVEAFAVSLSGVDQLNPLDSGTALAGGNISVTTVADNAWALDVLCASASPTASGSQSQQYNQSDGLSSVRFGAGSTLGPITPPGATTVGWSPTGFNRSHVAEAFAPSVVRHPRNGDFFLPGMAMWTPLDMAGRWWEGRELCQESL